MNILRKIWITQTDKIKFSLINRWTRDRGLTIVRIVIVDGSNYITAVDGSLHLIGAGNSRKKGNKNGRSSNAAKPAADGTDSTTA